MPELFKLEKTKPAEWEAFLAQNEYSGFMQSLAWGEVKRAEGWEVIPLAIRENENIVAAALVLGAKTNHEDIYYYSPMGPVLNWHQPRKTSGYLEKLTRLLSEVTSQNPGVYWRIEPWAFHNFDKPLQKYQRSPIDMQPRHTALIPLIKSETEIIAGFKPKARYNLRLAQKHGLETRVSSSLEAFEEFFKVYQKTVDRKIIEHKSWEYFASIQKNISGAKIITVYFNSIPIASILVIIYLDRLTYFFGGFDYEYRNLMAPYLCHLEAIRLGKSAGAQIYDLWGIADSDDPNHPWQSITNFKSNFNPIKISLTGAYDIDFNPRVYQQMFTDLNSGQVV